MDLWQKLSDAGGQPVGLDAIEVARIEAGLVVIDADYTPGETSPYDLSFDKMIAVDKGLDIIGSEILAKTAKARRSGLRPFASRATKCPSTVRR